METGRNCRFWTSKGETVTEIHTDESGQPSMISRYFYIAAEPLQVRRKTRKYSVVSRRQQVKLGTIKWYGAWRKYAFMPEGETIWSDDCLKDVQGFIRHLMAERKGMSDE